MARTEQVALLRLGTTGFNAGTNQSLIAPTSLIIAENLSYSQGSLEKEGGIVKFNNNPVVDSGNNPVRITGGVEWRPETNIATTIISTTDGKILKDKSGQGRFNTTMTTGLNTSFGAANFVEGGKEGAAQPRKLFFFNRFDAPQVVLGDADTAAPISQPSIDWTLGNGPVGGFIDLDRLWAYGNNNDPHRLYYSAFDDHENFVDGGSGSVSIYPGEGERIVKALTFKDFILVFKFPFGIYAIDTRFALITDIRVQKLNDKLGAAGNDAVAFVENDVMFMDATGTLHFLSRVQDEVFDTAGLLKGFNINKWIRDNMNFELIEGVESLFYPFKSEVHFSIPTSADLTGDKRLVVDFNDQLPRVRISDRDRINSMWLRRNEKNIQEPVYGSDDGFVYIMDQESKSIDGDMGYVARWQTPHMDLSHLQPAFGAIQKNFTYLELVYEALGNWDITIEVFIDYKSTQVLTFTQASTEVGGQGLGAVSLGTWVLGSAIQGRIGRQRLIGSGRRISLRGSNAVAGQNFSITAAYVGFTLGSERQ